MADVFISYSRENRAVVRLLADAVRREGYSLWWDDELPPHRSYGDVITEQIGEAKAAIVVWSQGAAGSEWVRAEADLARNQKKLIQTSIDGHMPPMPFNQIQFASIGDWTGEADHPGWRKVRESLAVLCGAATDPPTYPIPAVPPPAPPPPATRHKRHGLLIAVIAISLVGLLAVATLAWMRERTAVVVNQVAATPETAAETAVDKPEVEPPPAEVVRPVPAPVPVRPAATPRPKQVAEAPPRQATPPRATVRYCRGRGRGTPECAALRRQVRDR